MNDNHVTITKLSTMTGISRRSIQLRVEKLEPIKKKGRNTYYVLSEALAAIYKDRKETQNLNMSEERTLLTSEQRKKAELERRKLEGSLIETELVVIANHKMLSVIKAKITGLPVKVAAELAAMENIAEIAEFLRKKIHQILIELSDDRFAEIIAEDVEDFIQKSQDISATT